MQFQSTLPRGERRNFPNSSTSGNLFQSTLPRGERHDIIQLMAEWLDISIHAPTRGATYRLVERFSRGIFQSTLPRGERQVHTHATLVIKIISIHAPTRGATKTTGADRPEPTNFNPRSHEGSDTAIAGLVCSVIDFNPRSHEGSDCVCSSAGCAEHYFNPRSHEGSDKESFQFQDHQ